jgi:hypothetical protein
MTATDESNDYALQERKHKLSALETRLKSYLDLWTDNKE